MNDLANASNGRPESAARATEGPTSSTDRTARGLVRLAQGTVLWERIWRALWPAAGVAGVFLSLAFLDLLPLLPSWLHGIILVGFAALVTWLAKRGLRHIARVGLDEARHRIERDSGLRHRPLTAIRDRLSGGADDVMAQALWHAHQRRAAAQARGLRVAAPSPGLARLDPYALRCAVMILLAVGLVSAVEDPATRLARALFPATAADAARNATVEIWITPPAYTGKPPIFLKHDGARQTETHRDKTATSPAETAGLQPVAVPIGSAVLVQIAGIEKAPSLRIGTTRSEFAPLAAGAPRKATGAEPGTAFRAEATIDGGDRIAIESAGVTAHEWPLQVIPDRAPTIALSSPPGRTQRAQLRIDYEAEDDYGVAEVAAIVRQPDGRAAPGGEQEIRLTLRQGQTGDAKKFRTSTLHDLSAHPWAGTAVTIRLEAKDARGQTGASDTVPFVLPERFFNHPVARALVEQRKRLSTPSPEVIEDVVQTLEGISARPALFSDDTVVYLALRIAMGRLAHDGGDAAVGTVQKILWETALRIEDGKFSIAERDLRDLQERLQKALRDNNRESEEVEKLLDALRRALDKFLSALVEDMQRQGREAPMPFDPNTMREIDSADLHRMIEEARELARAGQLDAARRMLAELQKMLQSLQQGLAMGPQNRDAAKGRQMMDNMRELSRRQQQLLDRSFQKSRRGDGGRQGQRNPGDRKGEGDRIDDARAQNALRRMLGDLMTQMDEMMGGIPDAMGRAERAMREAEGALGEGNPGGAVPHQTDAVEALREAIEGAGEQMAKRFGGQGSVGRMPGGERGQNRDPFGRQQDGASGHAADGDVKVPDRMERMRSREILDELRRRSGEHERPVIEREYIDRLLRQF